jgi:hypothetical protein
MATVVRDFLSPILLACQQRLMDVLRWPVDRVRIYNPRKRGVLDVQGDQYVNLWLGEERAADRINDAGGRVDTRSYANLHVFLRTRCALDEDASDLYWLTHPELGHYVWRWAVLDALQIFLVEDAARNALTVCPLHWRQNTDYERDPKMPEWGHSEAVYVAELEFDILTSYSPRG